jgi:hypothetical protein
MTAPARAQAIRDLQRIIDRLRKDPSIPAPETCWALDFHAKDAAAAEAIARSLGVRDRDRKDFEYGWPSMRITGTVGAWKVRITADTGARVLEPVADRDPSLIHRTYPAGVAL